MEYEKLNELQNGAQIGTTKNAVSSFKMPQVARKVGIYSRKSPGVFLVEKG